MNSVIVLKNVINNRDSYFRSEWLQKINPSNQEVVCQFANSAHEDVNSAILAAQSAYCSWTQLSPVVRGNYLRKIANSLEVNISELSSVVAIETGKSLKDAEGEVQAAVQVAHFFAGEGARLFGKTIVSNNALKQSYSIRSSRGVAALIVPANTPIANIAWKVFPALICGNTAVVKSSEDAPLTAQTFMKFVVQSGLPEGIINLLHGAGSLTGHLLVSDPRVSTVSFTGSTPTGKLIAQSCNVNLTRVSLELGGKNAFVVTDNANLDEAVKWCVLSAFSNAGQRCAAGSRVYVFESVYEKFKTAMVAKTKTLKVGTSNDCDYGPVINQMQYKSIIDAFEILKSEGATLLTGGHHAEGSDLRKGFFIAPTIFENVKKNSALGDKELFGPVAYIYKVKNIHEAIELTNQSRFGLTSAIHTKDIDQALFFAQHVKTGVVNVNIGTFGSEPHVPFGGFKESGNGTREPGTEAIDFYSELKVVSMLLRTELV